MNNCFHGWSKAGPLQGDFTPIEHIPIGPLFIDSSLFSTGVVGVVVVEVVVEVVPLIWGYRTIRC